MAINKKMNLGDKYAWLRTTGMATMGRVNANTYYCSWTSHSGMRMVRYSESNDKAMEQVFEDLKLSLFDRCLHESS